MGAIGFLLGLQVGEGILGLDRVAAMVPASICGLVFALVGLVGEYRRKPDPREEQEVYVPNERYDE
jgi:hypothetical protein